MKNSEFNYKKYMKPNFQPKNFTNREWPINPNFTELPKAAFVNL